MNQNIEEKVESVLSTKEDIRNITTKEELCDRGGKLMTELKVIREEISVLSGLQVKENENNDRLEIIERKLDIQPAI